MHDVVADAVLSIICDVACPSAGQIWHRLKGIVESELNNVVELFRSGNRFHTTKLSVTELW